MLLEFTRGFRSRSGDRMSVLQGIVSNARRRRTRSTATPPIGHLRDVYRACPSPGGPRQHSSSRTVSAMVEQRIYHGRQPASSRGIARLESVHFLCPLCHNLSPLDRRQITPLKSTDRRRCASRSPRFQCHAGLCPIPLPVCPGDPKKKSRRPGDPRDRQQGANGRTGARRTGNFE